MKKLCFVVRGLTKGGVKRFIENVLKEMDTLALNEYELHIIHNELSLINKFENMEGHYCRTKNRLLFDYAISFYLLLKLKFDLIIYPKNVIPLNHFLVSGKKINVVHDLGYFEKSLNAYPWLDTLFMKCFMKISCQYGDLVLSVSNFTRQDLENRFKLKQEKIAVINEGVEERFQVVQDEGRLKKTLTKYNLENRFLFYAGSLSPRKNLKRVIEAFNNIKHDITHDLVLTGIQQWGAHEFDSNLRGRLKIIGYVCEDELVDLYNSADLYLYPSLYEGFGLPILEAQRCGCPVLTSNTTSCPEVAGEGALIVDPCSSEEIAAGILKILQDQGYRDDLIEKGFKNLERYSWRQTAKQILKVLRCL